MDREAWTVKFDRRSIDNFAKVSDRVAKIVGVSDDYDAVQAAGRRGPGEFGDHVSAARSQPYYADVTHPDANKGGVVRYLSQTYEIAPDEIATIGDMPNDVLMFAHSGLSIAMGNAEPRGARGRPPGHDLQRGRGFRQRGGAFLLPSCRWTRPDAGAGRRPRPSEVPWLTPASPQAPRRMFW